MAKMGEPGVNRETMAKMGGTRCGKNRLNSSWQKWVELNLDPPWQKWVEITVAKKGGGHHGING